MKKYNVRNTRIFQKELFNHYGNEFELVGEYVNWHYPKTQIKHIPCGRINETKPSNVMNKKGRYQCKYCSKNEKWTTESFKKEVERLFKDEYSVLSEYVDSKTKMKFKHNLCGNEFDALPNKFLSMKRLCKNCVHEEMTHEEFKEYLKQKTNDEYSCVDRKIHITVGRKIPYDLQSLYTGMADQIRIKHNKCGNEYFERPFKIFEEGYKCPFCKE